MVIEKITGGKPQEIKQAERAAKPVKGKQKTAPTQAGGAEKADNQITTDVSDRSKAAIKAYRLAAESSPDISRASRMAQIKAQVLSGSYGASSTDVATAIMSSVVKGG